MDLHPDITGLPLEGKGRVVSVIRCEDQRHHLHDEPGTWQASARVVYLEDADVLGEAGRGCNPLVANVQMAEGRHAW